MKIVNIDGENLHIFITTYVISTKFSGKMYLFGKTDSFLKPATLIKNELFLPYFFKDFI